MTSAGFWKFTFYKHFAVLFYKSHTTFVKVITFIIGLLQVFGDLRFYSAAKESSVLFLAEIPESLFLRDI